MCKPLTFGSLFAGIGGFDLGLERAGMVCKWQVEIDDYATKVLERHWPNLERWRDVREFAREGDDISNCFVDLVCGGFPCQDISVASSTRTGINGHRSGLWFEYLRIVRKLRPSFIVIENSPALLKRGFSDVARGLAESGYMLEWRVFSARDFGAPHERDRLYTLAYTDESNGPAGMGIKQDWKGKVLEGYRGTCLDVWLQAPRRFDGMDDGISAESYRHRVGCVGNAVVPQIVEFIGYLILFKSAAATADTETAA